MYAIDSKMKWDKLMGFLDPIFTLISVYFPLFYAWIFVSYQVFSFDYDLYLEGLWFDCIIFLSLMMHVPL